MTLRVYKFEVVVVCQEVDDDGKVIAERPVTEAEGRPFVIFGKDRLAKFPDEIEKRIEELAA